MAMYLKFAFPQSHAQNCILDKIAMLSRVLHGILAYCASPGVRVSELTTSDGVLM